MEEVSWMLEMFACCHRIYRCTPMLSSDDVGITPLLCGINGELRVPVVGQRSYSQLTPLQTAMEITAKTVVFVIGTYARSQVRD
ncbi:hypothetical protein IG631_23987 [Alternaria alternata]|nr:hypothetical protein IG631_23987 [Alternaria alternata]